MKNRLSGISFWKFCLVAGCFVFFLLVNNNTNEIGDLQPGGFIYLRICIFTAIALMALAFLLLLFDLFKNSFAKPFKSNSAYVALVGAALWFIIFLLSDFIHGAPATMNSFASRGITASIVFAVFLFVAAVLLFLYKEVKDSFRDV